MCVYPKNVLQNITNKQIKEKLTISLYAKKKEREREREIKGEEQMKN